MGDRAQTKITTMSDSIKKSRKSIIYEEARRQRWVNASIVFPLYSCNLCSVVI